MFFVILHSFKAKLIHEVTFELYNLQLVAQFIMYLKDWNFY